MGLKTQRLTPMDWKIYLAIKDATAIYGYITSEDLCKQLNLEIDEDAHKRNLSRKSIFLYERCEIINNSPEIEKIIIWDRYSNYHLARNVEEVKEFVMRVYANPAIKKLAKMKNLVNKSKEDGQGKIVSCQDKSIDEESKARDYVEAFMN